MTDKSIEADAARFRWLLDGHGYFMEEAMLCGDPPTTEIDKDDARAMIDEAMQPTTIREVIDVLKAVTELASRSICMHENTHRGGSIWEICSDCGEKWADDEGGRPADAGKVPAELDAAYDIIARLGR